jgi:hypothetical protein
MRYDFVPTDYNPNTPHTGIPSKHGVGSTVPDEEIKSILGDYIEKRGLENIHVLSSADWHDLGNGPKIIALTTETPLDVPGFKIPIFLKVKNRDYIALDYRGNTKVNPDTREVVIKNRNVNVFEVIRAALAFRFIYTPTEIETINYLPGRVFTAMISSTLGRRLQLERQEAQIVRNLAGNYWVSMFDTAEAIDGDTPYNEREIATHINQICKVSNTTADMYQLHHVGQPIRTLDELVEQIVSSVDSPKTKFLSKSVLVSLVTNIHDAADFAWNINVGLTHPPTFITSVILASMNMSKSTFSDVVKQERQFYRDGRNVGQDFIRYLNGLGINNLG